MVTVDCGISAVAEANLARELGIELIVTDHHTIGPDLPAADVLVHPRLPGSTYPCGDLCGAGVAFKLAWQICKSFGDGKKASPLLRNYLVDRSAWSRWPRSPTSSRSKAKTACSSGTAWRASMPSRRPVSGR